MSVILFSFREQCKFVYLEIHVRTSYKKYEYIYIKFRKGKIRKYQKLIQSENFQKFPNDRCLNNIDNRFLLVWKAKWISMKRIYCYVITWRNRKKRMICPSCMILPVQVSVFISCFHINDNMYTQHEHWKFGTSYGERLVFMAHDSGQCTSMYACELTHGMHYEHKWRVLAIFLWQFLNAWCFHTWYSLKR